MSATGPPVVPWPPRPPRRVLGLPVGLLVCWQAALLLALVAIGRPVGHVVALGIAAAALIAITGSRPRGRWAHEWVSLWLRYLLRSHREPDPQQVPELGLLHLATRVESVTTVDIEGSDAAVICHAAGQTVVLELTPPGSPPTMSTLPVALAPVSDPDSPATSVQLLASATPTGLRTWLAVQVRREARYPDAELRGAVVNAVRRLQRRVRAEQLEAQVLDQAGLLTALRSLALLELAGPAGYGIESPVGMEQWRTLWTRTLPQESLAIRSWPGPPGLPEPAVIAAMLGQDGPRTVSVAAQRLRPATAYGVIRAGTEVAALELVVRLAAPTRPALEAAVRQLRDRLATTGALVERLDGRQLPALAATLPLGGFLAGYGPDASSYPPPPRGTIRPGSTGAALPGGGKTRIPVDPPPPPDAPRTPSPLPAVGWSAPEPAKLPAPADLSPAAQVSPAVIVPPPAPMKDRPEALPPRPVEQQPASPAPDPVAAQPAPAPPAPAPSAPHAVPARGRAGVPVPARGQALVPTTARLGGSESGPASTWNAPTQDHYLPDQGGARANAPVRATARVGGQAAGSGMPTALPGAVTPPPPAPSLTPAIPPSTPVSPAIAPPPDPAAGAPAAPAPSPAPPPNADRAVRAYGASLFTAESPRRPYVEQLVALTRSPQPLPQVVSVVSAESGTGASATAAGVALTLASVRDDFVALLRVPGDAVDPASMTAVRGAHTFAVIDVGAHVGESTPQALVASTRVVVVTSAERRGTGATRLTLDRIHQVHPALVSDAIVAVVCRTGRQYRRVSQGLSEDLTPQASRIVPIPYDPQLSAMEQVDLSRLAQPTREAYLRLAAMLAIADGGSPAAGRVPTYTSNLRP